MPLTRLQEELVRDILNHASIEDDLKSVKKVNFCDSSHMNYTPLHYAVEVGNIEAIKLLITKGADPYIESEFGTNVVDLAREIGNSDVITCLSRELGLENSDASIIGATEHADIA